MAQPLGLVSVFLWISSFAVGSFAVGASPPAEGQRRVEVHQDMPAGFLGLLVEAVTPELREHFGGTAEAGLLVSRLVAGGPAAAAGIRVGDLITDLDGTELRAPHQLIEALRGYQVGDQVRLSFVRAGRADTAKVALAERPAETRHRKRFEVRCEDGDCESAGAPDPSALCAGVEPCELEVECRDGACTCTRNGEAVDCR